MNNINFQIHGNADHDGVADSIAHLLTLIENLVTQGDNNGGGLFALFMPGIAALENIHPLLVHFPIALLITFFLVDNIAVLLKKAQGYIIASYLLYFGTIAALFTVIAGFIAAQTVPHGDNVHEMMENHEHFGVSILILSTLLSFWRIFTNDNLVGIKRIVFSILSALLFLLIILGADLGGLMVYQYGVAVKAVPISINSYDHHHH